MLRNINMIRIRFINQSFIELRKLILNSIYNNNSLKLNNEINKRIIERFDNILDDIEFNDNKREIVVTEPAEPISTKINEINNKLGLTYKQLYILEVAMYLKEIKNSK
jgi:hypothetical protein